MKSPLSSLAAFLLAAPVAAQISSQQASGIHSSLAAGLSLDKATRPPGTSEQTLLKAPLNQTSAPAEFSTLSLAGATDYSVTALFASLSGVASGIEIDAHSTGNDLMPPFAVRPVGSGCYPNLGNRWMSISISVTNDSPGAPNGFISDRHAGQIGDRDKPGSDILSYYFADSQGIASSLVNRTLLEQAAETISYGGSGNLANIDALDWGMGVLSHAQASSPALLFPHRDRLYFSISADCVVDVNNRCSHNFAYKGSAIVAADAATIYESTWDGAGWAMPRVYRTPAQLGLSPNDDLDALAVNATNGVTVYSTQVVSGRSQLLADNGDNPAFPSLAGNRTVFSDDDGPKVTKKIKVIDESDDIDAVCISDPEAGIYGRYLGTPVAGDAKAFMGLSTTRATDLQDEREAIHVQVSGWGGTYPEASTVVLWYCLVSTGTPLQNPQWGALAIRPRSPLDDFTEITIDLSDVLIPPGYEVAFRADLMGSDLQVVSRSLVSRIGL